MAFSFSDLAGSGSIAVMGIINLSPDSFYSRSSLSSTSEVFRTAEKMIDEGAHILDVGAESTRPGSRGISVKLELERLLPVITKLTKEFNIPISVDTYKPDVALVALQEGATVINDISALGAGDKMANIVSQHKAGIVLMHMQGTPETMQNNPYYKDVCMEVLDFLSQRIMLAEKAGVEPESIAIDPGIGFGKNDKHNLKIFKDLALLHSLKSHVLIGASRKSIIGRITNTKPSERLPGSISLAIASLTKGVKFFRVHDVKETKQALTIWEKI